MHAQHDLTRNFICMAAGKFKSRQLNPQSGGVAAFSFSDADDDKYREVSK